MQTPRTVGLLALSLLLLAALSLPNLAAAEELNQAGLVVQFGDGRTETRCVAFEESEITGAELLTRSGLDLSVDASSGMGITVCQIEGRGCAYPAEPCFCHCSGGGECAYWNYFFRDPGASGWSYSALGAILRKAKPGSVEAWVWGDGHTPPADEVTFESVCPLPTPETTNVPASPQPPATVTATPTATASPDELPAASPTTTAPPPSPTPSPAARGDQDLPAYWPFGLTVLALLLIGVLVWLRLK
jgi:hypothetical protein